MRMSVLPKTLVYIPILFALVLVHCRCGCHAAAVSNNEPELYSGCVVCVCLSCVRIWVYVCSCLPIPLTNPASTIDPEFYIAYKNPSHYQRIQQKQGPKFRREPISRIDLSSSSDMRKPLTSCTLLPTQPTWYNGSYSCSIIIQML